MCIAIKQLIRELEEEKRKIEETIPLMPEAYIKIAFAKCQMLERWIEKLELAKQECKKTKKQE